MGVRRSMAAWDLHEAQVAVGVGTGWRSFTWIFARKVHLEWWHRMGGGRRRLGVAVGAWERAAAGGSNGGASFVIPAILACAALVV